MLPYGELVASSRKKVIVRRFTSGLVWGYLPTAAILQTDSPPVLDLLDLSGRVNPVPLPDVKHISYVRDFNTSDIQNPERLARKSFLARPRAEGLWVRVSFRDGDRLEGLASSDLSLTDDLLADRGIYLLPPDIRGNTQRLFVPRSAMASLDLLAVVTTPSKTHVTGRRPNEAQPDLVTISIPPGTRTQ